MTPVLMLDVDGVLLSDARPWNSNLERDLGISPRKLQDNFFAKHWHKIVIGKAEIEPLLDEALRNMRAHISAEALLTYWFENDAVVDQAVLRDVDALRRSGVAVFLATNQEHARATYLMEDLGLGTHVDGIIYSAALGERKPHRGFFSGAASITGQSAGAHFLVDDTEANVVAARKYGWNAQRWEASMSLSSLIDL